MEHGHEVKVEAGNTGPGPLQPSEGLYRTLVESSSALVWRCDAQGRYTFLNGQWARTLGYPLAELLGRPSASPNSSGDPDGFVTDYERTLRAKDGREVHLHFNATLLRDGEGRVTGSQGTAHDVTERKRVETYREAGREILEILNAPGDLKDVIGRVLETLKSRTGFDAVGIRLQEGEDFPYFVQDGFPSSFLKTENTLVRRDRRGVCRGANGRVCLECTCGLVLSGRGSPLLTARGSFWTNDSEPLLHLPPEEDPREHPRNQCIHHGYASVALVPIRSRERIVGLLQLNDRRQGCFAPERVDTLEAVAAQIGEALVRKQMEADLRESEQKLREYQERLRSMAFEAAAVQERERRRIAVDLHDSIGQTLALAQIKLTGVREDARGATRAAIEEAVSLIAQTILDSRTLVFDLSPPVLYDLGLPAAISWLLDETERKHGLRATLTEEGADRSLDETTAVVVFRAVRELMMNVIKHSGAQEAAVCLRWSAGALEVTVEDAGAGFDPEALPAGGSFGLFNVREQISRLGGTVKLTAASGRGTKALLRVPLARSLPLPAPAGSGPG